MDLTTTYLGMKLKNPLVMSGLVMPATCARKSFASAAPSAPVLYI